MSYADPSMALAPTEIPYTNADFETISKMVHAHSGICLPEGKAMLVYSRLSKLLRDTGKSSFAEYVALIRNDSAERARAIEALTTNHTKFFREDHHFDHFEREVRKGLIERLQRGERIRMWSSASSSGEEIYSLAMVLLGTDRHMARQILQRDVAMLATDLSQNVLTAGESGLYSASIASDIPRKYADVWTEKVGGDVRVVKDVRDMVRFRKLNLLNPWPIKGQFDVIFCRNVMIYFDEPTKEVLLRRLADQLAPGGFLYIGHSERLLGDSIGMFRSIGQTIYRKNRP